MIAATDPVSDLGDILEQHECGFKVISGDEDAYIKIVRQIASNSQLAEMMKINAKKLLTEKFSVEISTSLIISKLNKNRIVVKSY